MSGPFGMGMENSVFLPAGNLGRDGTRGRWGISVARHAKFTTKEGFRSRQGRGMM